MQNRYSRLGWICFLLFLASCSCVVVRDVCSNAINSTVLHMTFQGGPQCGSPCDLGETYTESYACTDGRGEWNNGILSFQDPIPADQGYVAVSCHLTVYTAAVNSCSTVYPSTYFVIFNDVLMSASQTPPCKSKPICPNCAIPKTFPVGLVDNCEVELYRYGGLNYLNFQPLVHTMCFSNVTLTIDFGPVIYNITSISPATGPESGGTFVSIRGNNFLGSGDALSCKFGDIIVPATFVDNITITCSSPASSKAASVSLEFSENGVTFTKNGVMFHYQAPATKNDFWVWVAIATCVLSVACVAIAGYFYAQKNSRRGDNSLIDENSRLINSDKYRAYGNVQPVDMSEIIIQQRIGRGSCAEVFMGSWRGTTVAIKKAKVFADDDEEFFMELSQEASIMSELRHPNVLQFLGTASNPPEIVIIMEFMSRGSLYRIIHDKNIEIGYSRLRLMGLDIARGMNYLHCSDPIVIHRDLKSHNLLVDEHFKVKVCDFGLSTMVKRHLDKYTAMTPVGTPCWTAPEVLRNEVYTEKADVYSFGLVLWELVTREDPYQGMPTFQIVIAVGQHKMRPLIPAATPHALSQLMMDCWNEDPNLRPPFADVVNRLEKL